jgi:hypothetical protein
MRRDRHRDVLGEVALTRFDDLVEHIVGDRAGDLAAVGGGLAGEPRNQRLA